jgi:hypothetical protein
MFSRYMPMLKMVNTDVSAGNGNTQVYEVFVFLN